MESKHMYSEWRGQSARVRSKRGLSSSFAGWTTHPDVSGVPQTHRVLDLANSAWGARLMSSAARSAASATSRLRNNFWLDISQNHIREPWGSIGCLTRQTTWYSYEHDCVLSGEDHALIQGLPPGQMPLEQFSEGERKSLTGEAFACPCIGLISALYFLNPWGVWWAGIAPSSSDAAGRG